MACNQTLTGIAKDCTPSMGGVVRVFVANHSDVSGVTVTDEQITAIAMAATAKFKTFAFDPQTASLSSNRTIDLAAGVNFVVSELLLQFRRMETSKRVALAALAVNDLAVIVEDANGKYWYLGFDAPVNASANDGLTGTSRTDRNGYSITLQDNSKEMPYEVLVGDGGVDLSAITE